MYENCLFCSTNVQTATNPSCCGGFTGLPWCFVLKKLLLRPSTTSVPACHSEVTQVLLMLNQPQPPDMLSTKNCPLPWSMQVHMTNTTNRDNQQINNITAPNLWNTLLMNHQRNLQKRLADIFKTCVTSDAMLVPLFAGISELRPQFGQVNRGLNN